MKILHIIPASYKSKKKGIYLGSSKDIESRIELLKLLGIKSIQLITVRDDLKLLSKIKKINIFEFSHIIFEYEHYHKSISYIKKNYSFIKIIVRSHNANLIHWADYLKSFLFANNIKKEIKIRDFSEYVNKSIYFFRSDIKTARESDAILTISEWEKKFYWNKLTNPNKVIFLPFFLAEKYIYNISDNLLGYSSRKNINIAMVGTQKNLTPLLSELVINFSKAVNFLPNKVNNNFVTTNKSNLLSLNINNLAPLDKVDNIYHLLQYSKHLFILSNYGYGFKTKILEAIQNGALVIVTNILYKKLPSLIKKYVYVIKDISSLKKLPLNKYDNSNNINCELRDHSLNVFKKLLNIKNNKKFYYDNKIDNFFSNVDYINPSFNNKNIFYFDAGYYDFSNILKNKCNLFRVFTDKYKRLSCFKDNRYKNNLELQAMVFNKIKADLIFIPNPNIFFNSELSFLKNFFIIYYFLNPAGTIFISNDNFSRSILYFFKLIRFFSFGNFSFSLYKNLFYITKKT